MTISRIDLLAMINARRVMHLLGLFVLIGIIGIFVASAVPQTVGADESYVVLSDSMSPSIGAGAVVFVSAVPTDQIQTGDVITFQAGDSQNAPVTHRVVGIETADGERSFQTKGDANEDPDPDRVPQSAVIGEVSFHVPLIGYVVTFAETDLGLVLLVVIPAGVLALTEIRDLLRAPHTAAEGDEDGSDDEDGATGEQP